MIIMSTSSSPHLHPHSHHRNVARDLRDADLEDEPENRNSGRGAWSQSFKKKFLRAGSMKMMSHWAEGEADQGIFWHFSYKELKKPRILEIKRWV